MTELRTGLPGSAGEHMLQRDLGFDARAARFYREQMLDRLNERMAEFVGRQEMMFVATADARGECDCSFRAGPPGFVHVLDERTLVYPEYRGNGVMGSLGNISGNGHAGLIFVDFLTHLIGLHVNGTAEVLADADLLKLWPDRPEADIPGRRARLWVRVGVEEAYIHCAKHIPWLMKMPRHRRWGAEDTRAKGGDFFDVKGEERPWT
ncbi:pyridoxamine 5'-phosphate oxidase family protein [Actinomadura barringtoniae]|uniref:Pyridoxamine 5'-phosphate oxidase family protein n=1 Tax=Actinomadura barringtoniae TaxID=1427535 RepID=A0A939PE48_9ACTN|nr:pyridoxamine 5'-phosphate oxidase family protein [Actinomadura barringtoniae]MBO2450935.1 pyridoxamine 5'-phosphate oxidase family protein [Actinomadura barringtoniae]